MENKVIAEVERTVHEWIAMGIELSLAVVRNIPKDEAIDLLATMQRWLGDIEVAANDLTSQGIVMEVEDILMELGYRPQEIKTMMSFLNDWDKDVDTLHSPHGKRAS